MTQLPAILPMSRAYCDLAPNHPVHHHYHAHEYGVPETDETRLFERLALEIMQAGLSWEIVLKKRPALNKAFHGFKVDRVARYGDADCTRLLGDASIIRNRLKIAAITSNAGVVKTFRASHGGFAGWLKAYHPQDKHSWVKLFKKTFTFTGGEITGEFLMSIGLLPGAHWDGCPHFKP